MSRPKNGGINSNSRAFARYFRIPLTASQITLRRLVVKVQSARSLMRSHEGTLRRFPRFCLAEMEFAIIRPQKGRFVPNGASRPLNLQPLPASPTALLDNV